MSQLLYLQGRTPVFIQEATGWAPDLVWTVLEKRNLLLLLEFEPQTIQSVAVHYTDYAIPTTEHNMYCINVTKHCPIRSSLVLH